MKSLELQEKGLLRCSCRDDAAWRKWRALKAEAVEAKKKLEEAVRRQEEVRRGAGD